MKLFSAFIPIKIRNIVFGKGEKLISKQKESSENGEKKFYLIMERTIFPLEVVAEWALSPQTPLHTSPMPLRSFGFVSEKYKGYILCISIPPPREFFFEFITKKMQF